MKNKIFSLLFTFILTTNAGFCTQTRTSAVDELLIKFTLAMVGVIVASVIIWAGLTIYNKILNNSQIKNSNEEEILKAPKTVDDAIKFFINKNRVK